MKIRLRSLRKSDAKKMLEWMHDEDICKCFEKDFASYSLEDAELFCLRAKTKTLKKDGDSLHLAIVDEDDEYLGTISLKNYDQYSKKVEYAIAMRKRAQGTGAAYKATKELINMAFFRFDVCSIYLMVLNENSRAIRFYEKCGFRREGTPGKNIEKSGSAQKQLLYVLFRDEYLERERKEE